MAQEFKVPIGTPRLTTTEKNALSSPQKGWLVYDLTLDKLQQYNGSTWETIGAGGGHVIQDEGTPLTARANLNFVGDAVTASDDPGNTATKVTIASTRLYREMYVAGTPSGNYTGSLTVFDLVNSYQADGKQMAVYVNGALQQIGGANDYVETDTNTVTFNYSLTAGDELQFVWLNPTTQTLTPSAGTNRREDQTATASPVTFNLSNSYTTDGKSLRVYVNGALQIPGTNYTEASSTQVTFTTGLAGGEKVSFCWVTDVQNLVSYTPATEVRENFAGTGAAAYDLTNAFTTGGVNLKVYVDGVLMKLADDYVETTNQRVTFQTGSIPTTSQTVAFIFIKQTGYLGTTQERRNEFVATASQQAFNLDFTFSLGGESLLVFNDGVLMKVNDDYTETSTSQISFSTGRASGSKVSCVARMRAAAGDADTVDGYHATYILDQMKFVGQVAMLFGAK